MSWTYNEQVVEEWSACMDHPKEQSRIALDADHVTLCRFKDKHCSNYKIVFRQLRTLLFEARGPADSMQRPSTNQPSELCEWNTQPSESLADGLQ